MQIPVVQRAEVLRVVLRRHLLLLVLVSVYAAVVWSVPVPQSGLDSTGLLFTAVQNFSKMIPQIICTILIWRVFHATFAVKPASRLTWMKEDILAFLSNREGLASGVLAALIMSVAMVTFGRGKSLIPMFQDFNWDYAFMDFDKILHLGVHPYEILFRIFPNSQVVNFLAYNYSFWFSVLFFFVYTASFVRPDSPIRMQFLVAFVLVWALGGNVLATIFSSAGPVYFERVGLGQAFLPLDQLLQERTGRALRAVFKLQDQLWEMYSTPGSFSVISAFPSMHLATSALMTIVAFTYRRWAGILMSIFTALIMVGSVMLAWHYAVDGYAGILFAVLCWKTSGWLIRSPIGPFAAGRE